MDTQRIKQPLTEFLNRLGQSVRIERVLVFGSSLEGNASQDSDIDVVVVSNDFKALDEDQRLDLLSQAAHDIEPGIDPWGFTSDELAAADRLSTLGYVRDQGLQFSM